MKTRINIDIGGTFTDCVAVRDGETYTAKVPTTPYNLSVGCVRGLKDLSRTLQASLEDLLRETESICYSTTLAMNTLLQRKGPQLALLTTEGFEDLYEIGRGGSFLDGLTFREKRDMPRARKPNPLIAREFVAGVRERVDYRGRVVQPLDEEDLRDKVHQLVAKGARGFIVCLLFGHLYPQHERRIREIIKELYPESHIGSMPVVLATDVSPRRDEYERMNATILDGYLHGSMAEELRGMGDELRDLGYAVPMLMVHNTGAMAEVYRTTALQTFNGGPVAGLIGGRYIARQMGYENVIVSDVGGTSFDIGLISPLVERFYAVEPVIDRWPVNVTMLETVSIGAGGGSIAYRDDVFGRLEVGPESAGAMPGPACYDLGGTEPTVTDADLVLGYINPDYYHGGTMKLNKDKATEAIREKVAKPLGMDVVNAAAAIRTLIDGKMGTLIRRETLLRGFDPSTFILFAYGGAGATHACGYGFMAGVPKIVIFPFSPVFCAYGSGQMDVGHLFERGLPLRVLAPETKEVALDYEAFNSAVDGLRDRAVVEVKLAGLPVDALVLTLEVTLRYTGQPNVARIVWPSMYLHTPEEVGKLYRQYEEEYIRFWHAYTAIPENGVDVVALHLRATIPQRRRDLPVYEFTGTTPARDSLKGKRPAYWDEYGGFRETDVYEQRLLQSGNVVEGPAIIEASDTTVVLPPGTRLTVNKQLCGIMEKDGVNGSDTAKKREEALDAIA